MKTSLLAGALVMSFLTSAGAHSRSAAQKPEDTASITGRVVSAETGRPIRGAMVRIVSPDVMRVAQTAVTDPQGRYDFTSLLPGRYQLSASADRHLGLQYGQRRPLDAARPIDLRNGEHFDKGDLALPRTSAIEGQLLDEFGDPAPNVTVQISRLTEQNESGGFAPTYYPGTPDLAAARPIRVGVAQDVTGVTFALAPAKMARVSGTLVDASGQPLAGGTVWLVPSDRTGGSTLMLARGASGADGRFNLRNVPPGIFVIQAFGPGGGGLANAPFGWLPVTVNGQDLTDLSVRVARGVTARGRIVFAGDAPRPRPRDIHVMPFPIEFDSAPVAGGGPPPSDMRDDGGFEVYNLSGLRIIRVDIASSAWSVERITYEGRDVTDEAVDFRSKDVNGLEIVLTSRAPSVSGTVVGSNGQLTSDYHVVLFATNSERWTVRSRFVHLARPNQDGRFLVQGLPPENYLAIALPVVQGTEWQDPEFLERIRSEATAVTLREGETRTLDLTLRDRR